MGDMHRTALTGCCLLLTLLATPEIRAQSLKLGSPEWHERCKAWIERKKFPVDYIEQRTGKRQPGLAAQGKGNVKVEDVRAGDVAIVRRGLEDGRRFVIAAYVERVEAPAGGSEGFITITTMGSGGQWVDQECLVTSNFGVVIQERLPLSAVVHVWRPSLPLE
jgi:hypothetical protein